MIESEEEGTKKMQRNLIISEREEVTGKNKEDKDMFLVNYRTHEISFCSSLLLERRLPIHHKT